MLRHRVKMLTITLAVVLVVPEEGSAGRDRIPRGR